MPLPDATPEQKRVVRVSAGTLLVLEGQAQKRMRAAADESVDEAAVEMARHRDADWSRAALLTALLMVSRAMVGRLQAAIGKARTDARQGARRRLHAELAAAGVALGAHVLGGPLPHRDEDLVQAQASADALAVAWRGAAVHGVQRALRRGEDAFDAVDRTRGVLASRIARTAATETAQAYNDEHRRSLEETARDPGLAGLLDEANVVRVWDAYLDLRTCSDCLERDGETTEVGSSFSGGEEPPMHPLCRCISLVMARPSSARAAA